MVEFPVLFSNATAYLQRCLSSEDPPRAGEFAKAHGYDLKHVNVAFQRNTGGTLKTFFMDAQIKRAELLLRTTSLNSTRIAYVCAFGSRRTFFRAYRSCRGVSPAEFRKRSSGSPIADEDSSRPCNAAESGRS